MIKRKFRYMIYLLCLMLIGVGLLVAALPHWIQTEQARRWIIARVCRHVDQFDYRSMTLRIWPLPHLAIREAEITQGKDFHAHLKRLTIYPEIIPLLWGKMRFSRLQMEAPRFDLHWAPRSGSPSVPFTSSLPWRFKSVVRFIPTAQAFLNDSRIEINQARINFYEGEESLIGLDNIQLQVVASALAWKLNIVGHATFFDRFEIIGHFNPQTLMGEGHLELTPIHLKTLWDRFYPDGPFKFDQAPVTFAVEWSLDRGRDLKGRFTATYDHITLSRADIQKKIIGNRIGGTFELDDRSSRFALTDFTLADPELNLTGACVLAPDTPQVQLQLDARDVDVTAVRELALAFFKHHPDVRKLFAILRGGRIPHLHLAANAPRFQDIALETLRITGQITAGCIHVPKPALDLSEVNGEVTIEKGVLFGSEVNVHLGKSIGRNGRLDVSISKTEAPFYLNVELDADLRELPKVLQQVVNNEAFQTELANITDITGKAVGRLEITDNLHELFTSVRLQQVALKANYRRLPFAVEIDEGQLNFDDNRITLTDVCGHFGASPFSKLDFTVDWQKDIQLDVKSLCAKLDLSQLVPWLKRIDSAGKSLAAIEAVDGDLDIASFYCHGSFPSDAGKEIDDWQFGVTGSLVDVDLRYQALDPPLRRLNGAFEAGPRTLRFTNLQADVLDASLTISLDILEYGHEAEKRHAVISGRIGPQATTWLETVLDLPTALAVRFPITLSDVNVGWAHTVPDVSVSGAMCIQDGPEITLALTRTPETLTIERFTINDEVSQAEMNYTQDKNTKQFGFQGHLDKATLDSLLQTNRYLYGSLAGNFNIAIDAAPVLRVQAQGTLKGNDVFIPYKNNPLYIRTVAFDATPARIRLESMVVSWINRDYHVSGSYDPGAGYPLVLNLSTTGLNFNTIQDELLAEDEDQRDIKSDMRPFGINTQIHVNADYLETDTQVFTPFYCDIDLSQDEATIDFTHVNLCGLALPGRIQIRPKQKIIHLKPAVQNQPMDSILNCLWQKKGLVSGHVDFDSELVSDQIDLVSPALQGRFHFEAHDGRIYRFGLLAKIVAFLNVIELFKTKLPDWTKEGFAYKSISARGHIENGRLKLEAASLDSPSMDIACTGEIDLVHNDMDLLFLVAPLKTVDLLVKYTPLVNAIFKGALVTIPITAKGSLSDPRIQPLPTTEVKKELVDIMERSFKLPGKIIQPWLDKSSGAGSGQ